MSNQVDISSVIYRITRDYVRDYLYNTDAFHHPNDARMSAIEDTISDIMLEAGLKIYEEICIENVTIEEGTDE